MFGCARVEIDPRHASLTSDGNSFDQAIDRRAGKKVYDGRKNGDMWWWLRPSTPGGVHVLTRLILTSMRATQDIMLGREGVETTTRSSTEQNHP